MIDDPLNKETVSLYKPSMFYDQLGNLHIKVEMDEHALTKQVPQFKTKEEYEKWVSVEAPKLMREVLRLKNSSAKRFKRRVRNAKAEKRREHSKGNHLRSVARAETTPEGND